MRPEDTHFWSPHLDVQLDDAPGGGTKVAAMFAPHPRVWTTFVALMLGREPWVPLGALGVMLFGGGFAYGAAYVGQGIGSKQMYQLRAFLERALRA